MRVNGTVQVLEKESSAAHFSRIATRLCAKICDKSMKFGTKVRFYIHINLGYGAILKGKKLARFDDFSYMAAQPNLKGKLRQPKIA